MRRIPSPILVVVALLALAAPPSRAQGGGTKLLRFPDIHGDQVAFVYAGDIWIAPAAGGVARQLTTHPGLELFPKFSPDGNWIAFTGQYDGDEQVYVVPTTGGTPKQLTFYPAKGPLPPRWGYDNQVYGWSHDGKSVLFRSMRQGWTLTDTRLYLVDVDGGLPRPLPMPVSGAGDLSPDGTKVVYTPLTRDFRSWKRYQGGWAQDLWIFDLATDATRRVTADPRTDRDPMWIGDTIYFASDRDGTLNLYAYDIASGDTRELTHSTTWDVRWPSDDGVGRIVYELGGELAIYDIAAGTSQPITIEVPTDALPTRPEHVSVADDVEDFELSPDGARALFVARGDVYTVPIEHGPVRNLTHSSGAHERGAVWSPDGAKIAYISDASGEEQITLVDQLGAAEPTQLTEGLEVRLDGLRWSPDSAKISFSDKDGKVYVLTVASRRLQQVGDSPSGFGQDQAWSPDSAYLAFSLPDPTGFSSLYVWSAADGQTRRITGPLWNEQGPTWDPHGKYLFYLADHGFAPQLGSFEFNYVLDRETGIYALALTKDGPDLFPPRSDEVKVEAAGDGDGGGSAKEKAHQKAKEKNGKTAADAKGAPAAPEKVHVAIDFDGLGDRVMRVPVDFDNYAGVVALDGGLLYATGDASYYGRQGPSGGLRLQLFSFDDRDSKDLADHVQGVAVAEDGAKVLLRQHGGYKLYDTKPGKQEAKSVSTAGLETTVDPKAEWAEIFEEVWRRYRDYFYVPNMHGYDWQGLHDRYAALLPYVGHRSDLNYVISEMIAELSISHAYITGGDWQQPKRPEVALPGAWFELDAAVGRYRISRILQGQEEEPKYRSPMDRVGVDLHVGDYVLAIDGEPLGAHDNPYRHLRYKADRPVELTVSSRPSLDGARKITFDPITDEGNLVYLAKVTENRNKVEQATGGRVGYVHIPDMGDDGIWEWNKYFYGQIRKDGLIVDVRDNGGGNVSEMILERLSRQLLSLGWSRNDEHPNTYPRTVFRGHLVCLINEGSASDGDIFPAMFKQAGLGPLIGKRTWGGVTGISGHGPLVDGGQVFVPEHGTLSKDGQWIIEGWGVEPDIEVDNDPKSVMAGKDPQLEKGIEVILHEIEQDPRPLPPRPAPPVKTPGHNPPPAPG